MGHYHGQHHHGLVGGQQGLGGLRGHGQGDNGQGQGHDHDHGQGQEGQGQGGHGHGAMQGLSQLVCEPMRLHAQLGQQSCGGLPW